MKKILRISASLLLMALIACASAVTCFAGAVNTLKTTEKDGKVLFNGTVDSETLAVSLMVYDQSGENLVSIASAAVDDKNEYNIEMQLPKGIYLVKAADYNGGKFLEKAVTVGDTENKDVNDTEDLKQNEPTDNKTENTDTVSDTENKDVNNTEDLKHNESADNTTGNTDKLTVDNTEKTEETPKSPLTGDNSNIAVWVSLLFASIIVLSATAVLRKKNRA